MADRDDDKDDDEERSSEPPESKDRDGDDDGDDDEKPIPKEKPVAKNTRKSETEQKSKQRADEPEPGSSSSLVWIGVAAAALLAGWWVWRGQSAESTPREEPPAARTNALPPPNPSPAATAKAPEDEKEEPEPEVKAPALSAAPSASAAPVGSAPAPTAGGAFDRKAALDALAKSASKAAACRMRGEPAGTANVTVTFEPSGNVKEAEIRSGPYSGSATGKCIVKKLLDTTVAPFSGEATKVVAPVSVR